MESRLKRAIPPVVALERDDILALWDLVDRANPTPGQKDGVIATGELRDGQEFKTTDREKIFDIPNKSGNALKTILLESESYRPNSIKIQIGGKKYVDFGAELQAKGSPDFIGSITSEFERLVRKEKTIIEWLSSASAIWWTLYILIEFVILPSFVLLKIFGNYDFQIIAKILLFIFFGFMGLVYGFISEIKYNMFGRASFLWGDGSKRYQKNLEILKFFAWSFPFLVLTSFAAEKLF